MYVGVQVSVPAVFPGPGVNTALLPAGRPERSAVRDAIGSPSSSPACTVTVTGLVSVAGTLDGAVTAGGRSTPVTVIAVVSAPESALAAVNVTV